MPKTLCIIQARMGSTRLPGKVLKVINNRPVLMHVYNRVKRAKNVEKIIVATTNLPIDDAIANFCEQNKIDYYRGDEQDVLSRYYEAAKKFGGDTIIRITSDCPLIEPQIIDLMLDKYQEDWAYFSNCHPNRVVPVGLDVEITNIKFLEQAYLESKDKAEREHVMPYFYKNPDKFKINSLETQHLDPTIRITLDTEEDFKLIQKIYSELKDSESFTVNEVVQAYNKIKG